MPLVSGSKLGPYEILSPIGAGGMGVYKAKDTRLGRIVAIKVLPAEFSKNPERRERFEREARTVSALSHPNICALFDIGQQDGIDFLVMDHLEGETLAERLSKGALPLEQALGYAVQIANALDSAHREGVVHRDLKPGNIMLIKPGAKLLDFGLAKPIGTLGASLLSELPTKQKPLTEDGVIPGTLPYMAPEQLEGKEADARTDLFAFGLVLYEMLTGRRAFEGKSAASLIAAILEQEPPPVSKLQPVSPTALDRVVTTCLAKDPDDRWQSARDLGRELKWISEGGGAKTVASHRRGRERLLAIGLGLLAVVSTVLTVSYFSGTPMEDRVARLQISPPREGTPYTNSGVSVSPDGRYVAWQTMKSRTIWLRPVDAMEGRELAVTPDAPDESALFWSPDSGSIGFGDEGKIKVIDISGGRARTICDVGPLRGATWNRDGVILFAQEGKPLSRVEAVGGEPVAVTVSPEEIQPSYPHFLPDGRRFLFLGKNPQTEESAIYVASIDGDGSKRLVSTDYRAEYAPPGYLLFVRNGNLMAQPFDAERLDLLEEPSLLSKRLGLWPLGNASFSVSNTGVLAYRPSVDVKTQLVWLDREGRRLGTIEEVDFIHPDLSSDATKMAAVRVDPQTGNYDIWLVNFERTVSTRFTFPTSIENFPIWSPDGSRIVFHSDRERGLNHLYEKSTLGVGDESLLLETSISGAPFDWSSDGRFIVFVRGAFSASGDIWVLPLDGNSEAFALVQTEFHETKPQFSPDGRWIAYVSNESGNADVYVSSFPDAERR